MDVRIARPIACISFAAAVLIGCATPPPESDQEARAEFEQTNDPFEPANRAIFDFNQGLDRAIIKPAATAYRDAVPPFGRDRVNDIINNTKGPLILVNDVLQGEMNRAGTTVGRFLLNSTFGVLGIMDVATPMGMKRHDEDFGQTLAVWGVPEGPYLMLPLLGPSNPRDGIGKGVEFYIDPLSYATGQGDLEWFDWTRTGMDGLDTRVQYLDVLDDIERSSLDYYASIRSMYRQNRAQQVKNVQK